MNTLQNRIKLPGLIASGSLFLILVVLLTTSPLKSIVAVSFFFVLLTTFLISFSFAFLKLQGTTSKNAYKRSLMVCAIIVLLLMLRSAKALSLLDAGLMLLFFFGLTFYISRR